MNSIKFFLVFVLLFFGMPCIGQSKWEVSIPHLVKQINGAGQDTNRVNSMLALSQAYTFKPGESAKDLDSAVLLAWQAQGISRSLHYGRGVGKSYTRLSQAIREKKDTAKSRPYADKAIEILAVSGRKDDLAEAWQERSMYYDYRNASEHKLKIACYKKAVQFYKESNNKEMYATELINLVDLESIYFYDSTNIPRLKEALHVYQSIGYKELQWLYDLIGRSYTSNRFYKEGLKNFLLALETATQLKDSSKLLCTINNHIAEAYYIIGNFEEAGYYWTQALTLAQIQNDLDAVQMIAPYLADNLVSLKKPAEAIGLLNRIFNKYPPSENDHRRYVNMHGCYINSFLALNDYANAERHMNRLIIHAAKIPPYSFMRDYQYKTGLNFYLATHQYDQARTYLTAYEDFLNYTGKSDFESYIFLNLNWFKVDSAQGRYLSAIQHYQQYKLDSDSLFNGTKDKEVAEIHEQFKTTERINEIENQQRQIHMLDQQAVLQQGMIRQAKTIRNIIIAASGILLLSFALLYNRYQIKQRNTIMLEKKQAEINSKNQSLELLTSAQKQLINEKEWLLKEIHHRVKNNLQTIMSLLESQSAYLKDDALSAVKNSQNRVQAMSIIHQKLYQTENVTTIHMSQYLPELIAYLRSSFNTGKRISFQQAIDPIELDVTQAMPVGLIFNEAITNCLKYAFPDADNGIIDIRLKRFPDGQVLLKVSDNGVGLPHNFDSTTVSSLGMRLMKGLTEDINGTFAIQNSGGTTITIKFKNSLLRQPSILTASKQLGSQLSMEKI